MTLWGVTRVDRLEPKKPHWRDEDEIQEQETEIEAFQDRHRSFSDKVERLLLQVVILGLVALVLVQTLQLNRFTRLIALEGVTVAEVTDWSRALGDSRVQMASGRATTLSLKVMVITRRSVPQARLLVDGQPAGDFGEGAVALQVRPGQILTIDGAAVAEPLLFRVTEVSGLAAPALGATVTTRGNQVRLGVVKAAD